LRLPVCSDFRTNFHAYSRHYGVAWLERPIVAYLRAFHNATALTMVPTEALKRELATFGFERLVAVGRGVDTARFDPAHRSHALRGSWGAGGDTPVALFVGRLASEKNLGALAAAFAAMRQARPDTRLVVVGDGPAWHELLGVVPGIHFAGTRRGDDLAVHYASADVFVFPSMTETFGNVTTEAMASGLAVAAYDHAAAGQLIRSGSNGLLAPMGDQETFVAHAVRLVRERDTAARMGALARATACEHGWDRIVAQVEATIVAAIAHTEAMHTYETAITALRRAA
jgi:glycosyltransferase involved in cell wall biosynthesis